MLLHDSKPSMLSHLTAAGLAALLSATGCFADTDPGGTGDDDDSGTDDGSDEPSSTSGDSSGDSSGDASGGPSSTTNGTTTEGATSGDGDTADPDSDGDGSGTSGDTAGDTGADACEAGFECIPMPPAGGWNGPAIISTAETRAALLGCPEPFPSMVAEAFDEPNAAPAQCSACACGDPTGVECTPPRVQFWGNSNCGDFEMMGPPFEDSLSAPGQCKVFNQPLGGYGAESSTVTAVPDTGSCPRSGGEPTLDPPSWGQHVRVCGEPERGGTCDAGTCLPAPGDEFDNRLCIWRPGDASCPPGPFLNRKVWYTDAVDNRDCTPCNCTAPGGAQCDTEVNFHFDATCTDPYVDILNPGQECITLWGEAPSSAVFTVNGVTGGSCAPSGGEPAGSIMPDAPMTICCT